MSIMLKQYLTKYAGLISQIFSVMGYRSRSMHSLSHSTIRPGAKMSEVTPEIRASALKYCQQLLHGAWKELKQDRFQIKQVSGGLSNYLYVCSLPEDGHVQNGEPRQILLRYYGEILTGNADAVVLDSVVFALLSEKKLGPKLYGVFHGGRLEEYIPSRSLTTAELRVPYISKRIAQVMAKFHVLDMPVNKEPVAMFEMIAKWLQEASSLTLENAKPYDKVLLEKIFSFKIEAEFETLKDFVIGVNSPVVFCHNDLQEGNILCFGDTDDMELMAIDFEYCNYNYRGCDIANHFNEWVYDYTYDKFPFYKESRENYPSREEQIFFLKAYLSASGENEDEIEQKAESMLYECSACGLISHFLWGTWSLACSKISHIEFGYLDYALVRFEAYFRQKAELAQIKPPKKG
ncbi:choline/ethanolamine kinase isoform X2 [Lingula anatina]|uniref:Choline/ethanolamine kinase isoform X2 n=1 Tax=Lingula anatina TaxID=7574 RepID=A0A1S3JAB4_LINAN|nr:choline/ethanolamine kinase isoform X2 [Lingula anatina]|eukprot:XP_013407263.1 choline/ethanolamine kinase isoform X2 [Lingula anatina]